MDEKKLFKEIENLKKLLMLSSLKAGASVREIRGVLKVSGKDFKRLMSVKISKRRGE